MKWYGVMPVMMLAAACNKPAAIEEKGTPANAAIKIGSPVRPIANDAGPSGPTPETGKPGTPSGLPDDRTPLAEPKGPIDPKSAEGAGQVVQLYMALIGEGKIDEAQKAWGDGIDRGPLSSDRLKSMAEVHGEVGKPFDQEGGAGSIYISVPVRIYGKAKDGTPVNLIGSLALRRVNDVDGSTAEQRRWHIISSDLKTQLLTHPSPPRCVHELDQPRRQDMAGFEDIKEHMEVIGADGVHVGTVDHLDGDRIKLTKKDSGQGGHEGHHHYISRGLVAGVEGDKVRLSANGDVAVTFEEEENGAA